MFAVSVHLCRGLLQVRVFFLLVFIVNLCGKAFSLLKLLVVWFVKCSASDISKSLFS